MSRSHCLFFRFFSALALSGTAFAYGQVPFPTTFQPEEGPLKQLRIGGYYQGQFYSGRVTDEATSPAETLPEASDWLTRRSLLGFQADFHAPWTVRVYANFSTRNNFDHFYLRRHLTAGGFPSTLDAGYAKVAFGREENTSAATMPVIERSLATRYFTHAANGRRLGFGARHVGLFWSLPSTESRPFFGGLALTTPTNETFKPHEVRGQPGIWAHLGHNQEWAKEHSLTLQLNSGWKPEGNRVDGRGNDSMREGIAGLNPQALYRYQNFRAHLEFLVARVENGRVAGLGGEQARQAERAVPLGANFTITQDFESPGLPGRFQPVFRWSWVDTDGRGLRPGDAITYLSHPGLTDPFFDRAYSVYAGANWYLLADSLRLAAGYEIARLRGSISRPGSIVEGVNQASAEMFRLQLTYRF